jgi:hypothetical protein
LIGLANQKVLNYTLDSWVSLIVAAITQSEKETPHGLLLQDCRPSQENTHRSQIPMLRAQENDHIILPCLMVQKIYHISER